MRAAVRDAAWVGGVVIALQLVFMGLLVLGAAVPDRAIVDDLAADVRSGAYGTNGEPDRMGGRSTTFTDCVSAGTGLGRPDYSALERAVRMPRLESCRTGAEQIRTMARGEELQDPKPYFRYWAGYTVVSRPVLAVAGMDGMRLAAGGFLSLALVFMVLAVTRVTSAWYALALVTPLLLSSNVLSLPSSGFSHALSLGVIFSGVALVAWSTRHSLRTTLVAVAVAASVFNFVDLLTTPAIGWAMVGAVVAAGTFVRSLSYRRTLGTVLVAGLVWPAAYAVTWVSRWLFAAAFLGWDHVMSSVLGIARFRVDGEFGTVNPAFGAAVPKNWETWRALPVMPELVLLVSLFLSMACLVVAWRRFGSERIVAAGVLAGAAAVVPAWLVVMSNHSQIHDHFVYRGLPVAVGIILGACVVAATAGRSRREGRTSTVDSHARAARCQPDNERVVEGPRTDSR